jgi:coenzyme F420-dependent glucose-6-phosphate dehydrogenase
MARYAASAGFRAGMCSDHFHPWSERQGQSGFAWSWLGAALEATGMSFGTVCAPGQRYHPAVVAQAAATLAEMYPGRFWLAVGSGEALNERITGDPWPAKEERHARLKASVDIMRALWAGETVTADGPVVVRDARLYTRPTSPPALFGAALTVETARWLAPWVDGLTTVAGHPDQMRRVLDAFREAGGERKPVWLQVALAYAPTQVAAERGAYDQWRHCTLGPRLLADLPTPAAFDRAGADVDIQQMLGSVRISCDFARHVAWVHEDLARGYDRLYLHNVVREEQERFIDLCGERLLRKFESAIT